MQDFQNLEVWQVAHQIVLRLYRTTNCFPQEELYGLTSQIRRSAASIPANIAEGCGRQTDSDFRRILHLAMGSACELEYHLILARDLSFLDLEDFDALRTETVRVKKMLASLIAKLASSIDRGT